MEPTARKAFPNAYFTASLLKGTTDPKQRIEYYSKLVEIGELIVMGIELPAIGEEESRLVSKQAMMNRVGKWIGLNTELSAVCPPPSSIKCLILT
ncbi:MAG: hypothetical protein GTO51_03815 [Candidatus Latescibacteria bacterium]|nr:hypothetical protein [Candidatus Latescibacterota bacterium]NIM20966.1 hypothetical protein [Candidatus Latescibacterota bacterium]NIM65101.1 hypothetical protein [Candidatus Latescibacterota bacterium]NIO01616.1 hypothetical protein [Candidatus Latescibacterota bacterium]NIO28133.1 hypothetical protein [Candidatus Latescibacterota bacterium]